MIELLASEGLPYCDNNCKNNLYINSKMSYKDFSTSTNWVV